MLTRDGRLLFATRSLRLFAYGLVSVILALYLTSLGLTEERIGLLLTLTLVGDTAISLWMTTSADRLGRRKMLIAGALLMLVAAGLFAATDSFALLLLAATIGVISPSGNEVGPFLPIEQAALSQAAPAERRTALFAWYNLAGSAATAVGSLVGGLVSQGLIERGAIGPTAYRPLILAYGACGLILAAVFTRLTPAVEVVRGSAAERPAGTILGLGRSRGIVLKLSALFGLDSFGGGFVIQSIVAYWFHVRFGLEPAALGSLFFAANLLAAASSLSAAWLARRIGLVNTMVFTHLPSNVLLILVPLMPTVELAIAVLLARFSISQMDVPTRQSYLMSVVEPEERSAASGVTGVARSIGASLSPGLAGWLIATPALLGMPFFLAGGIKIVYDLWLYSEARGGRLEAGGRTEENQGPRR